MSLINKMLQDLDKRGGAGDGAVHSPELKAVPKPERDRRQLMLAGAGVAAVVVLAAGGWYGWQAWQGQRVAPGPVPRVVDNQLPPGARSAAPPPAPAAEAAATMASEPSPEAVPKSVAPAPELAHPTQPLPVRTASAPTPSELSPRSPLSPAPDEPAPARARRAAPDGDAQRPERKAVHPEGVVRQSLPAKLESDGVYRRALAALQEGRLSVAMADLDRALDIDPRNEGARQTYISLLLENKRADEAIRQLRLSLGIDPRQPGLAMVLARLQLERGGPALATLMTTLPHAGNNADYQAFLAGVLQREQRHAEAARYYRDALRLAPDNGVWWMGLAISLQADQHLPEAREAYTRARAAAGMTPELLAFIDRKLEQLGR